MGMSQNNCDRVVARGPALGMCVGPSFRTTPHEDDDSVLECGLTGSVRSGRKAGFCGAPWSGTSTPSRSRPSMFSCRRWWTNRWRCSCPLTFLIPSRLLKCPRSRCQPALNADSRGCCRRRSNWWKCRWKSPRGSGDR